ncbi:MAG: protein-L-isoaspartate O-methyltransferase [Gammaproteobacteria bacterium]|nr:MAG: protein-L-isoaspartate O-methyltransferase [Gammaproteobacteria bacterium]
MDMQLARFNMMEQQIRPWDVLDQNVLDAIEDTPRELFVPPEFHNLAYADIRIPIGHDQVMLEPKIDARLIQELRITKLDRILEIGTGTGYTTALLARLGLHVTSVDYFSDFLDQAAFRLKSIGLDNVQLVQGDASKGWKADDFSFDVIFISGYMPKLQKGYKNIMNRGGRLVYFSGEKPVMSAVLVERCDIDSWHSEALFESEVPALIHCEPEKRFIF